MLAVGEPAVNLPAGCFFPNQDMEQVLGLSSFLSSLGTEGLIFVFFFKGLQGGPLPVINGAITPMAL